MSVLYCCEKLVEALPFNTWRLETVNENLVELFLERFLFAGLILKRISCNKFEPHNILLQIFYPLTKSYFKAFKFDVQAILNTKIFL